MTVRAGLNEAHEAAIADALDGGVGEAVTGVDAATIGQLDDIRAALQGPAMRAVMVARVEQLALHGHDREHDSMLPLGALPRRAREMLCAATDVIDATREMRNLAVARRRLARTAALCLAAIDRLDMAEGGRSDV